MPWYKHLRTLFGSDGNVWKDSFYAVLLALLLSGALELSIRVNPLRWLVLQILGFHVLGQALLDFLNDIITRNVSMNKLVLTIPGYLGSANGTRNVPERDLATFLTVRHPSIADLDVARNVKERDELAYATAWLASLMTAIFILTLVSMLLRKYQDTLVNSVVRLLSEPHKIVTHIMLSSLLDPVLTFFSPVASVHFASLAATIVFDSILQYSPLFLRAYCDCETRRIGQEWYWFGTLPALDGVSSDWLAEEFAESCENPHFPKESNISKVWQQQLGTLTYLTAVFYSFAVQTKSLDVGPSGTAAASIGIYAVNALFRIHPVMIENNVPFLEVLLLCWLYFPVVITFGILLLGVQGLAPSLSAWLLRDVIPRRSRQRFPCLIAISLINLGFAALSSVVGVIIGRRLGSFFLVHSYSVASSVAIGSHFFIPICLVCLILRFLGCWSWLMYQSRLLKLDWDLPQRVTLERWRISERMADSLARSTTALDSKASVFDRILELVGAVSTASLQDGSSTLVEATVKFNLKVTSKSRVTLLMPRSTLTLVGLEKKLDVKPKRRFSEWLLSDFGSRSHYQLHRALGKITIGGSTPEDPIEVFWSGEKDRWRGDVPLTLNVHIKKSALSLLVTTARHSMTGSTGGISGIKLNLLLDTVSLFHNYKLWFLLRQFCIPIAQVILDTNEMNSEERGPDVGSLLSQSQRLFSLQKLIFAVMESWLRYSESIHHRFVTPWEPWKTKFDAFNNSIRKCIQSDWHNADGRHLNWRWMTAVGSSLVPLIHKTRQSDVTDSRFLKLFKLISLFVESLLFAKVFLTSQKHALRQRESSPRNTFWVVLENVAELTPELLCEDVSVLCRSTQALQTLRQVEVLEE